MAKTASQTQWEDLASKIKAAGREILYGTSATAANTAAKVATTTKGTFVLETGAMVRIKFTNANSFNGTATLAVDGTTAKNIVQKGTTTTTRYWWDAGEVVDFVYDGTNFVIVDGAPATTTYYGVTKLADSDSSSSTALALVPNSLYVTANNTICPYYSASKTYALGDKVRYSKKLYKCTTAITTAEAWNAAHWTAIDPLQQQLDDAAFIGADVGTPSTVAYVATANIADAAVTTAKLGPTAVTTAKIANGAVTSDKIDFTNILQFSSNQTGTTCTYRYATIGKTRLICGLTSAKTWSSTYTTISCNIPSSALPQGTVILPVQATTCGHTVDDNQWTHGTGGGTAGTNGFTFSFSLLSTNTASKSCQVAFTCWCILP